MIVERDGERGATIGGKKRRRLGLDKRWRVVVRMQGVECSYTEGAGQLDAAAEQTRHAAAVGCVVRAR